MRVAGVAGRTVTITVRIADFTTITRSRTLPEATDVGRTVYETAVALYEALGLERARLRLVGVRVEGIAEAAGVPHQLALGEKESGWREAEQAVDKASRRFGTGAVRPATLVDPGGDAPAAPSSRPPSSRGKRDR
jgi:DNA polymerase-4